MTPERLDGIRQHIAKVRRCPACWTNIPDLLAHADELTAENERLLRGMTWAHYELAEKTRPDTLWLMDLLSGLLGGKTADQAAGEARHDHAALDEHQCAERAEAERDVLRAAANEMAATLEYVWEAHSHGVRVRNAIDRWRRAAGLAEPGR